MRRVSESVVGTYEAVISFDNSIPHLVNDEDILAAFVEFQGVLTPWGIVAISVRDYDSVDRSTMSNHQYGTRLRDGNLFRLNQEWEWLDSSHYRTTMVVEKQISGEWTKITEASSIYYAISITRLLELMTESGLLESEAIVSPFYQPVLIGRNAG